MPRARRARHYTRPLQIGFLALLAVSSAQLVYWMTDEVRYTARVQAELREAYEAQAESARALLESGVPWREVHRVYPALALLGDSATVRVAPHVLARLESARARRLNRYAWEGAFFLAVLLAAMAVVYRTLREQARLRHREEDFLAAVSHELQSPLASVRLSVETLALRDPPAHRRAELVQRLLADLGRLQRIIANILDASRLSVSGTRSAPERVPLAESVRAVVDELSEQAAEREITVQADVPDALEVWADPEGVRTILRNLLHNAIRAAAAHVTVRASAADARVRLEVRDDGVGFPPQEAPRLFEKFYRVEGGRPGRGSGTGLGLYLVARYVQLDGGSVSAASAGPDAGSSFVVTWSSAAGRA